MSAVRFYTCVLCSKTPKPNDRRKLEGPNNRKLRNYLERKFFVERSVIECGVICNKCRVRCHKEIHVKPVDPVIQKSASTTDIEYVLPPKYVRISNTNACKSPPCITLPIPSAGGSHSQCLVCKRYGPKLLVVPTNARFNLFLEKTILLPIRSRCCSSHLLNDTFLPAAVDQISQTRNYTDFNHSSLMQLIIQIRDMAVRTSKRRIDFDKDNGLSDSDIFNLTGLSNANFEDLCSIVQQGNLRDSRTRSVRTCIGIFLTKLKSGMSNTLMSTIFNVSKNSIRRSISSARKFLTEHFVPSNLGFQHISREEVISKHTRPLAQSLFGNWKQPAILLVDGTYIYIQKSSKFLFQRRCYNMHKHRPLVKPMVFVTTTGYIVSVMGPYLSDGKNNDAKILNHIVLNNLEEIKEWMTEDDVFIVDRGFRDSIDLLNDLGVKTEMPAFLKKGEKQYTVEDSNTTRLITKIRWVVESVNGRIKLWRYLEKVLPNSQLPFVSDYVKIACSLINKYWNPVSTSIENQDEQIAAKMLHLSKQKNLLQDRILSEVLEKRPSKWTKVDACSSVSNFPRLSEEDIRNFTIGVYQLKMAKSYTQEHLDKDGEYEVLICSQSEYILSAKMQSRHRSAKKYQLWIEYNECTVCSWYCQCKSGARVVGTCSHVTSLIWYLGLGRYVDKLFDGCRDWSKYLSDAENIPDPEPVDESDAEENEEEE